MSQLDGYSDFSTVELTRQDGILLARLHTDDGPLVFGSKPHGEWVRLWAEISEDSLTRVVIITGTGDAFMPARSHFADKDNGEVITPRYWGPGVMDPEYYYGSFSRANSHVVRMLNVPVPMIAAVNGPLRFHSELALLNDIVIATPDTVFQDLSHLPDQAVAGDLQHVMMPELIGRIRAAYYLYTDQVMDASEAHRLGLINEIVERDDLLPRAFQIAQWMLRQPDVNLRYMRRLLTHELRGKMHAMLELGLAVEGLALMATDWTGWATEEGGLPPLRPGEK